MRIAFRYIAQLWVVAWLAVAIGGCSEEGVSGAVESESGDKQIGFTIQSTTMSSKATVIADGDDLQKKGFKVGAYIANSTTQYIPDSQLEYDEGNYVWRYTDDDGNYINRYWPSNTSTLLSFIAYYPDVALTVNDSGFAFDYTVASSPDDQYDLIYAFREDVECPEESPYSVQLPLCHALTQVVFKAESSLEKDVKVTELEIHNLKYTGTFTVSDDTLSDGNSGVWALDSDVDDFSAAISSEGVTVPSDGSTIQLTDGDNVMILMPQTFSSWEPNDHSISQNDSGDKGAYLKILCDLDSDYIYVPISSQDSDGDELWDAGYIVTYTLTFGMGYDENGDSNSDDSPVSMVVTATLNGWDDGGDYDVEF